MSNCPRFPCSTRFPSVIDGKCRDCRTGKDKRLYREHMDAFRKKCEETSAAAERLQRAALRFKMENK